MCRVVCVVMVKKEVKGEQVSQFMVSRNVRRPRMPSTFARTQWEPLAKRLLLRVRGYFCAYVTEPLRLRIFSSMFGQLLQRNNG